jgi:lipopolysaccharide/colanic/teichoic acid biosynthesis glycosyltransferase
MSLRTVLVASAHGMQTQPLGGKGPYVRTWKLCFDRFPPILMITVAAPIMALIALLFWVSLGPNVIYRQQRIGIT